MSIAAQIERLNNAKNAIRSAIIGKGVQVPSTAKIDAYNQYINLIEQGGGEGGFTEDEYVTMTFKQSGNITANVVGTLENKPTLYYSKNGGSYQLWNNYSAIGVSVGDVVKFYGVNNETFSIDASNNFRFASATPSYDLSGNLLSLLNKDKKIKYIRQYAFYYLFYQNKVVDASGFNCGFADTYIGYYGLCRLFYQCTSLTKAPQLPSMALANYCYSYMFYGCSVLTDAPQLPSMTLATYCYANMFQNCTSLTEAPQLPATTLVSYCYQYMFGGCSSLTKAPTLPSTTLATYCYQYMFSGCSSLTEAPTLPSMTLANYCYAYMFQNCTSLTEAPTLPSTTLASYCYAYMFQGCSALTKAPTLQATTLVNYCYAYMFRDCTSLTKAPFLPSLFLITGCYNYMFYGCTNLNYIKAMFRTTPTTSYTNNWVYGVASSGTYVKNASAAYYTRGVSQIPSGWTIETVSE